MLTIPFKQPHPIKAIYIKLLVGLIQGIEDASDEDPDYALVVKRLSEEDGGGYLVYVPDLPGCVSDGATEAEARANVRGALRAWMECAREMGRPIPPPTRNNQSSTTDK